VLRASRSGPVLITVDAGSAGPDFFLRAAHAAAVGSPHASLGALYGWTAEDLVDAAARLEREPRAERAGREPVLCSADMAFRGAQMVELDRSRGPEDIFPFLARPAALGFIYGHSCGFDMEAGPAIMCRRSESDTIAEDELRVFPCYHGTECGRCRPGQPQVGPGLLRTRRLVLISCWGVTLSGALFDPAWTVGEGIFRNTHVETLVTTMRASRIDALDLPHLYYLSNQGLSLGEVANRANQFRIARGLAADFICFGDPLSSVQGSVKLVTPRRSEQGVYRVATDDDAAHDLAVSLEGESIPEEPVVVVESDGPAHGLCEPRHAVFLSVQANTPEIEFRIVDRRELAPSEALSSLARDLQFARSYARCLAEQTKSAQALEALETLDGTHDAIETCPLLVLALGAVTSSAFVDEALDDLEGHLTASARGTITAFVEGVRRQGTVHPAHVWQSRSRMVLYRPCERCPYCGSGCDEAVTESRAGGCRRSGVYCHTCGLIFDGDPALGSALVAPATVTAGERITVELPIKNPYSMAVPACGVAVLESFKRGDCSVSDLRSVRVPSGKTGTLPFELTVAESSLPGVYYLGGGLMVGGRVQFFRRPVHMKRGGA
jgi:hypothetical protein